MHLPVYIIQQYVLYKKKSVGLTVFLEPRVIYYGKTKIIFQYCRSYRCVRIQCSQTEIINSVVNYLILQFSASVDGAIYSMHLLCHLATVLGFITDRSQWATGSNRLDHPLYISHWRRCTSQTSIYDQEINPFIYTCLNYDAFIIMVVLIASFISAVYFTCTCVHNYRCI